VVVVIIRNVVGVVTAVPVRLWTASWGTIKELLLKSRWAAVSERAARLWRQGSRRRRCLRPDRKGHNGKGKGGHRLHAGALAQALALQGGHRDIRRVRGPLTRPEQDQGRLPPRALALGTRLPSRTFPGLSPGLLPASLSRTSPDCCASVLADRVDWSCRGR